jgi:hypothetical protein
MILSLFNRIFYVLYVICRKIRIKIDRIRQDETLKRFIRCVVVKIFRKVFKVRGIVPRERGQDRVISTLRRFEASKAQRRRECERRRRTRQLAHHRTTYQRLPGDRAKYSAGPLSSQPTTPSKGEKGKERAQMPSHGAHDTQELPEHSIAGGCPRFVTQGTPHVGTTCLTVGEYCIS